LFFSFAETEIHKNLFSSSWKSFRYYISASGYLSKQGGGRYAEPSLRPLFSGSGVHPIGKKIVFQKIVAYRVILVAEANARCAGLKEYQQFH
jgi:hypothetical protein